MKIRKLAMFGLCFISPIFISSCVNGIKTTDFRNYEVGELTRAESATVVSRQRVNLSNWWPFGLGLGNNERAKGSRIFQQRLGFTYFVKLERTGEMLAITQADDIYIPVGGKAWVQFGERVRLLPYS